RRLPSRSSLPLPGSPPSARRRRIVMSPSSTSAATRIRLRIRRRDSRPGAVGIGVHVAVAKVTYCRGGIMGRKILSGVRACLLLAPHAGSAQTFGQITGIVTDTSGGVLIGSSITVTNTQTGATATQQANGSGVYVFPNLLPGIYTVKVEMDGFNSAARNRV